MNKLVHNLVFIFFFSLLVNYPAFANLALSEYRLYFDANNKSNSLLLRNTAVSPMQYSIQLIHLDMTEEGTLIQVDEQQVIGRSAQELLRFSPKRGVIQGNGMQAVRFSVRKPANLPAGEYRAALRIVAQTVTDNGNNGININPKIAYSVPIIIRHGHTKASASIEHPQLIMQNSMPTITLLLERTGNRSLYGDFSITNSENQEIGRINGIALYPPLPRRTVNINLTQQTHGTITIRFIEPAKYGGNITLDKNLTLN
jgi:P pilus assembly chaperone PapD